MKNKKLFAILTLVCFMFTLMPVAAFATTPAYVYDSEQVYVVKAGGTLTDEMTEEVVIPEQAFNAYVGDATDSSTTTASNYVFYVVDEDGEYVDIELGGAFAGFKAEGDYTVYAINVEDDAPAYTNVLVELAKITSVESKVAAIKAWAGSKNVVSGSAVVTVEDANEYVYAIQLTGYVKASEGYISNLDNVRDAGGNVVDANKYVVGVQANDGFKKDGKVIAKLVKGVKVTSGTQTYTEVVKGAELKISEAGYVDVAYDTLKTDNKGQVYFEVTADYANNGNKVIVSYGSKAKVELTVNATNSKATSVVVNNAPALPQNNENDVVKANIEFKFADANGVPVELATGYGAYVPTSEYAITIVEKPAKSNMKADKFALLKEYNPGTSIDTDGVYTLVYNNNGDAAFDKDGTYVIKVALENGSSATATVKVAEMGDVVKIMFVKGDKTIAYGESAWAGAVMAVDANGVMEVITPDDLSVSGLAVIGFQETHDTNGTPADLTDDILAGTITADPDDKYIGSKITVMAVYGDFTATTELTVVDKAKTIEYLSNNAEVGISTKLTGQIKDSSNSVSAITGTINAKAIVLSKPANAVATASAIYDSTNKVVVLTFLASQAGEYEVQTIVTYGPSGEKYISGIETITVGGGVSTFKDVVVLSIGANNIVVNSDVKAIAAAPMIKDNRTFVPFRALAEAFGADVEWVEATQSVVAELNGVKVVMNIGANAYTVNGAAKTADVAPFINGASTMVPVRFVAEAFGINVTPIYAENGAVADVLFAK